MILTRLCLTSALALSAHAAAAEMNFNRIASFATVLNMADGEDLVRESSAEIIAASGDGMTLVYTDSPLGVIGRIDISDPRAPKPLGNVDMGGEPTAVSVVGSNALVAVNTSESYTAPSGKLAAVDLASGMIKGECDFGGQPDSTAAAPDGSFLAIAIENERDEDAGDGRVGQAPEGWLVKMPLVDGMPDCGAMQKIAMTGLAEIAPEDPEPEFVDVNAAGEIAVTLQENNHIVVVGADGTVSTHFSAGAVDLTGIDATDERGALIFTETQQGRLREPDGLGWIDADHFITANEGDMDGGSRGFTVFAKDGTVVYESGTSLEYEIVQIGHYPDKRSDAKGAEPEGMEVARFGDMTYAFILSERGSVAAVYDVSNPASPKLKQLLPSGIAPEGVVAIPARNLLVTANEADLIEDGGARAHVMIYEYQDAPAAYPQLTSAGSDGLIGWGALSGLTEADGKLYAVNDGFYGYQPTIFEVDPTQTPARITRAIPVTRAGQPAQKLDLEGIAADGDGGFWLASEGRTDRLVPHAIYHVNGEGEIEEEIAPPAELLAQEQRFGFEGIAKIGNRLWMAVQREWGDDPKGMVKLVSYDIESKEWGAVHYPLDTVETGWIGLSEIAIKGDSVYVIERDNQIGAATAIKKIARIPLSDLEPAPLGAELPVVNKEVVHDFIPVLTAQGGYVTDKIEGLTFDAAGDAWVVTDNDGVDDSSGETFFWKIEGL
ncbi:esterase-like activity of phytase family protein [Defluviimonas aestuarii]|uniref:esterase-like activity of phytase family protein n=1 Tax=Albidovulum aestuarii TaxID=1130726 RepID=UPI002499D95A|nr:esterase-like activity of phytase family protein [Defluviimonas aestuarii]MDI3337867.1 esterase-like activity of phytase family protein [Defluviimonas aestuarii]